MQKSLMNMVIIDGISGGVLKQTVTEQSVLRPH